MVFWLSSSPPARPPVHPSIHPASRLHTRLVSLNPNWMSGLTQQALTWLLKCLMESLSRYPAGKKKRHVLTTCSEETRAQMFPSPRRSGGWQETQGTRGGLTRNNGLWPTANFDVNSTAFLTSGITVNAQVQTLLEPSSTLKSPFFFFFSSSFYLPLKFDCTVHKLFCFSFFLFRFVFNFDSWSNQVKKKKNQEWSLEFL